QNSAAWESNIYMRWLACLRELSTPTTDPRFPEVMRTRPWALKTLNTQLSSWTHLRHDTILYAKQSYTDFGQCTYPTGFIERRVESWQGRGQTLSGGRDLPAALTYQGPYSYVTNHPAEYDPATGNTREPWNETNVVSMTSVQARQLSHLRSF